MTKILINSTEYAYRHGWGATYYFESACSDTFDPSKHAHLHLMYYCQLLNANPDTFTMTQNEFIAELDADPSLASRLDAAFLEEMERWNASVPKSEGSKKKKRNRSQRGSSTR